MNNIRVDMPKGSLNPLASGKWLVFGQSDTGTVEYVGTTCNRQHAFELYVKTYPDDKDMCLNCGS